MTNRSPARPNDPPARFSRRVLVPLLAMGPLFVSQLARAQVRTPPEVIERVEPEVPSSASPHADAASVRLEVLVDELGNVAGVKVLDSASPELDEAAIAAVKRWRFRPAQRDGKPVRARIPVTFGFTAAAPPPSASASSASPAPSSSSRPEVAASGSAGVPSSAPSASAPTSPAPSASAIAPPASSAAPPDVVEVNVHDALTPQVHGPSDIKITVGDQRRVPRGSAADYLKLAPGILLSNEGGEGHAEQVFLRGFDAREGQDIEFSVDGIPINDSGNLHGNGYADTHFIIPELILGLRVTEGPFAPHQGNYAVAGSADFHLGLESRGITAKATYGSWNTARLLLLWGPGGESPHTYAGVEAYQSDGYGTNRAAKRASAMAQYEIPLPNGAALRIGGQAYTSHFQTAGVIRLDDWQAKRVDFLGTEDPLQGGDASRYSLFATYEKNAAPAALSQTLFLIRRDMRLREDFTGFLLDTQNVLDTLHPQRGDLLDLNFGAWTLGGRGMLRWTTLLGGLTQSLDVGYLARVDLTRSTQYRNTVPGNIPYHLETDLDSTLTDIGLFADTALRIFKWLTIRGGARVDVFDFNVLNNCAATGDFDNPSKLTPPINQSCHDQMAYGAHREPVQRSSTGAVKIMPRTTATIGPIQGFNISFSYGEGVRSIDPTYVSQDLDTPFASVRAFEGGVVYTKDFESVSVSARSIFFETKVDRDLVFSQTAGRNVLANGTTRVGWAGAARVTGSWFDESANLTLVRPTFDDTNLPIPYVPTLVLREDAAVFHALPWRLMDKAIKGSLGVGWTYVGPRALPYGQLSDAISVVDLKAAVEWSGYELSLAITNLFDTRYRLGEYNYASDFHTMPEPTLVPARHFTAGAPRGAFLTLGGNFGGGL